MYAIQNNVIWDIQDDAVYIICEECIEPLIITGIGVYIWIKLSEGQQELDTILGCINDIYGNLSNDQVEEIKKFLNDLRTLSIISII